MKRIVNFVIKNWISLTVGFLLAAVAFRAAYDWRGHFAIGSEWLVLPFTVFVLKGAKAFITEDLPMWIEIMKSDDGEEDRRCVRYAGKSRAIVDARTRRSRNR